MRLGVAEAGIRKANRKDVTLVELAAGSRVAGVFTTNRFCAAPVQVCKAHLAEGGGIRALVVNTGIANAGTGELGLANARQTCESVAALLGTDATAVLPFSTGVILEHLPMDRLTAGLPAAQRNLRADGWFDAAHAIMTTDTIAKAVSRKVEIGGVAVTLTGMSKGAGMIKPNMATMLGFLATDAAISQSLLDGLVKEAAGLSFNAITIDGDTSTNDSFILIATGCAANAEITDAASADYKVLRSAVIELSIELAQAIVRDGEGATKFVEVRVTGASDAADAHRVAMSIANSPLVKTAIAGQDANWGRIVAAIGKSGARADRDLVSIRFGDLLVAEKGWRVPDYSEEAASAYMRNQDLLIHVDLGLGKAAKSVWTCDLTHRYIDINADYRS